MFLLIQQASSHLSRYHLSEPKVAQSKNSHLNHQWCSQLIFTTQITPYHRNDTRHNCHITGVMNMMIKQLHPVTLQWVAWVQVMGSHHTTVGERVFTFTHRAVMWPSFSVNYSHWNTHRIKPNA